jgi:hypothetical protein
MNYSGIDPHSNKKRATRPEYDLLTRVPGIGRILATVIALETGSIERLRGQLVQGKEQAKKLSFTTGDSRRHDFVCPRGKSSFWPWPWINENIRPRQIAVIFRDGTGVWLGRKIADSFM